MKTITDEEAKAALHAGITLRLNKLKELDGDGDPVPNCDINNPNDPHYGESGAYNSRCIWIPF